MDCRSCGNPIPRERAELGYDYCTEPACVRACLKPLNIVAVHVNKASDQYVLREDLHLPDHKSTTTVEPGWAPLGTPREPVSTTLARRKSTLDEIDDLEAALDAALAIETDPEKRNKLVNDYNASLRRFDIRYRRVRQRR
jgi:hypothetical protein